MFTGQCVLFSWERKNNGDRGALTVYRVQMLYMEFRLLCLIGRKEKQTRSEHSVAAIQSHAPNVVFSLWGMRQQQLRSTVAHTRYVLVEVIRLVNLAGRNWGHLLDVMFGLVFVCVQVVRLIGQVIPTAVNNRQAQTVIVATAES